MVEYFTMLADYHTAQVPPARRGRVFRTRREELSASDLGTILSRRDYHVDLVVFVAQALRHPRAASAPRSSSMVDRCW